jgi:hypothetical protein
MPDVPGAPPGAAATALLGCSRASLVIVVALPVGAMCWPPCSVLPWGAPGQGAAPSPLPSLLSSLPRGLSLLQGRTASQRLVLWAGPCVTLLLSPACCLSRWRTLSWALPPSSTSLRAPTAPSGPWVRSPLRLPLCPRTGTPAVQLQPPDPHLAQPQAPPARGGPTRKGRAHQQGAGPRNAALWLLHTSTDATPVWLPMHGPSARAPAPMGCRDGSQGLGRLKTAASATA